MSNRIYVYTVLGKDAERWERAEGSKLTTGAGLLLSLIHISEPTRPY